MTALSSEWKVNFTNKAAKQFEKLSDNIKDSMTLLYEELKVDGPYRTNWPNYGKLKANKGRLIYHCHIEKGKPTYVVCWEIVEKKLKILEVYYVGTHEKAPY